MSEERAFWLAWSQLEGIGPILLNRLKQQFGSLITAWEAHPNELEAVEGLGELSAQAIAQQRSRIDPQALLRQHEQENPRFWTPADADYPRLLLEIPDPPAVLYYRGTVDRDENRGTRSCIGIVGTRYPTEYGRRWTRKLSTALAHAGFTVVSGLAQGIDTEAHRSCVTAGGRTLAVMGTGVDIIYPWNNRALSKEIRQQGLLLSEYPAQTPPDRVNFPRRNRIIAGLCRVTLVLEAPQKSGSLITARLANDYGRDVYALPGSLDSERSLGCLELLNNGAQVILGEDHLIGLLETLPRLQTLSDAAPMQTELPLMQTSPQVQLSPQLDAVLQTVKLEPISIDLIVQQAQLSTADVLSALAQLELMGLVTQMPGMRYQRC